ncbi:MAG: hypothetical protein OXT67_07895 [Zetaproteobacteria bacterium]|nr:hypothetical protein [Zetaproteobacteria bacterium]
MAEKVRFPYSQQLFHFCHKVLCQRDPSRKIKDQEVGALLGLESAECSHWKNGRKAIKSIQEIYQIARALSVDPAIVGRVAQGELSSQQGFAESYGYCGFALDPLRVAKAKRDVFCQLPSSGDLQHSTAFARLFDLDLTEVEKKVAEIHKRIHFLAPPLYLPEVVMHFAGLTLLADPERGPEAGVACMHGETQGASARIVFSPRQQMDAQLRFEIASCMGSYFLPPSRVEGDENRKVLHDYAQHRDAVRGRQFASHLLVPTPLLLAELSQQNPAADYVQLLAEVFWVAPALIRRRLWDVLAAQK